jgi:predicted CxxxxCH...CXXCH cytochrome family protein
MLRLFVLLLLLLLPFSLTACSDSNSSAPPVDGTHPPGWLCDHGADAAADIATCKGCHPVDFGDDYANGIVCMSCHTSSPEVNPSGCISCHGKPPDVGAHLAHNDAASIHDICSTCHEDGGSCNENHFNGVVDVAIEAVYDAETGGPAVFNLDATCDGVSCHGGQTTPDWFNGSIVVDTQCGSCHIYGMTQYNSYYSGFHQSHVPVNNGCTVCHNPVPLSAAHFSGLDTPEFEGDPGDTISGSAIISYNPASKSCNPSCHATARW